ncbi:MAG: hypothetical protein E6Q69_13010 [Aquipseudomonas alcaligenes]|uniref:PAS fold-4 domain-containing protein n=1 Tax=Aquipseudomonas alcaligenes TaxID=43263 RepID=A0A5C7W071_AQUAC|nr:MAG: hypothetical protein E6Q69_13010 [Pseudomonas alcaligenes]
MFPLLILVALLPSLLLLALLQRHRRLLKQQRALLAQLEFGALEVSANGRVRWHNEPAPALLGQAEDSLRGARLADLLPAAALDALTNRVACRCAAPTARYARCRSGASMARAACC